MINYFALIGMILPIFLYALLCKNKVIDGLNAKENKYYNVYAIIIN